MIFDLVRKKFIPLTPEEWVRQHCIAHLNQHFNFPLNNISIEREIRALDLRKRFDIVAFAKNGTPLVLVECKAPNVKITQNTVIQAGVYNKKLDSQWMWITNGMQHVWLKKEGEKTSFCQPPNSIER